MKRLMTAVAFGGLVATPLLAMAAPQSDEAKLSYSIGATLGQSIKQDISDLDTDAFTQAVEDVYAGDDLQMSDDEIAATLSDFQKQKMAEQKKEKAQSAEKNRKASEAFLEENAKKDGVKVTDSGLQYKVLESGDGETPSADDTVKVNYEGKLPDGTVFDSSYERGEPITFQVGQVIEGWQEALQKMQVGDTWMLYVPADLAYGQGGTGGPIGPNQALTFKIELLGIEAGDDQQASADE
ncbi:MULTISPECIES: FKBP-type peptidyl-prolyl cis-trans isomerase [Chromohalobacter]|uniref:FKBP-type peptidyl-prolyl cis-trans isomerase n=1 Tax=Chromohalobacter TaxID=42054 RepID=UPI001FFD3B23|nr:MULTISPECIES: FKBP-type peptidyl-prolyl cis-trans isomerase [Chromohalobacter]MCK2045827.1 FKBP-type peptidyl-prolyl cis-trans isomerase [Chromohalobacter moromii]MCT8469214.1 FKBP-type peptidyl-prolyl cis-trans isomerase [Chromohalobacter canadensis]MCT8472596.1 FKBP-type peptidyl-prolyl cis-trans isomerase [Chromohalobacter canadensis]MCT8500049.1 FKBP-type peptidyl-prolyl cis-trans isomerase [Chromohalobacter canadensis]